MASKTHVEGDIGPEYALKSACHDQLKLLVNSRTFGCAGGGGGGGGGDAAAMSTKPGIRGGDPWGAFKKEKVRLLTQLRSIAVKRPLDCVQMLGEGAYGQAFRATEKSTGVSWCVKEIQKQGDVALTKEARSSSKAIELVVIAMPWGLDACALPRVRRRHAPEKLSNPP